MSPLDIDGQPARIIGALEQWLAGAPGRSVRISYALDGWRAQLEERHPARGESLTDCLAQVATACVMETG